jgi:hypothetical protein
MKIPRRIAISVILGIVGSRPAAAELVNVAPGKPATESSDWGGFPAGKAVDGDRTNAMHTATADASPWLEVSLEELVSVSSIAIWNRGDGCCQSRLRDITVTILDAPTDMGGISVYTSDLLNPEGVIGTPTATGPKVLFLDLTALAGGPVDGKAVRVTRTPDPDLSGNKEPVPNADDPNVLSIGELEVYAGECGDFAGTCEGLDVVGPAGGGPGLYTATATSFDAMAYRFTFSEGGEEIVIGPQADPMASLVLQPGAWTVSVNASADPICPSTGAEGTCTLDVVVKECSEDPPDTHCMGLTIDPPPGGPFPGLWTFTAASIDDSADPVIYSFTATNGVDPPLVAGPGLSERAAFDLGEGSWTVTASLGDNAFCPPDGTGDSTCTETVEVKPLSANPNVAPQGIASQSTGYAGADPYPASLGNDGIIGGFTHTAADDPAPWWRVDLDDVYAIDAVKITNRVDCCRSRLRDISIAILDVDGAEVWRSDLLNPDNVLGGGLLNVGPNVLTASLAEITGGAVNGAAVRVERTPDPDLSGSGWTGNADEANVLSVAEVEVFAAPAELPATIVRDISLESFSNETSIPIALTVTAKTPGTAVRVREALPEGVGAASISGGGVLSGIAVEWDLAAVSSTTLTYDLIPGGSCSSAILFPGSSFVAGGVKGRVRGEESVSRTIVEFALGDWTSEDIGTTGGAVMPLGTHELIVEAPGAGIKGSADEFRFVHLTADGDFSLTARIDCASGVGLPQAGLVVRDGLEPGAAMLLFYFTLSSTAGQAGTLKAVARKAAGAAALPTVITANVAVDVFPIHLRLAREGESIILSRSDDGDTWTPLATKAIGASLALGASTEIGLAASSAGTEPARFVFSEVSGPEFPVGQTGPRFLRGDPDASGKVDLTDAVQTLGYLFLGNGPTACLDASDTDDSGKVDLTDAILLLTHLYLGGDPPSAPFPDCGLDPKGKPDLGCEESCR